MLRSMGVVVVGLVLGFFTNLISAAVASSTFIEPYRDGTNFTFALNIPNVTRDNDLYFHMSGNADSHSWLAFGIGNLMDGALIFVAYPINEQGNLTISPRIGDGHREPTYTPNVKVDVLPGSYIDQNNTFVINGHCHTCRSWAGGRLDERSHTQEFIYAFGPNEALESGSLTASLRRHTGYGHFNMDMVGATGTGGLPTDTSSQVNATAEGGTHSDADVGIPLHALFMAGTFVILLPLSVIFLRVFERVTWHRLNNMVATVLLVAGAAIGLYESTLYNKTKQVRTPHQIIGLIVVSFAILQATAGYFHHRMFLKTGNKSKITLAHRIAGPIIIGLGLINGGLGFQLGSEGPTTDHGSTYGLLVAAMIIFVSALLIFKERRKRRAEALQSQTANNFRQGLEEERLGTAQGQQSQGVELGHMEPPPVYMR